LPCDVCQATTFDPTILKSLAPTKAAGSDAAATDAGDDYRADIGTTVSSDLIAQLDYAVGKDAWKQRNEALGIIQDKATQMAKFGILPSATCKELLVALTRRFADTNNNLRPKAVDIITVVAKGLGKDVEKVSWLFPQSRQQRVGVHILCCLCLFVCSSTPSLCSSRR
jgi:hypothetical protein